jgi:tRNA pseudouridine38-40 synthase
MKPLNIPAMQEAAQHLLGHHDFTSFRDSLCQAENPCRTIDSLTVTPHGELIYIDISARAFLHHQVRIITGTLKKFGFSDCNPVEILDILAAKARAAAGETAPAQGLFYLGVQYPEHMKFVYPTLRTADFTLT